LSRMRLVAAAIVFDKGKVLLARRKWGEDLEGHWEFPGGKVEPGETPQRCVERELREELGVEAVAGEVVAESVFVREGKSIRLIGVLTKLMSRDFLPVVHDEVRWVPLAEVLTYRLAPADVSIAKQVLKNWQLTLG